MNKFSSYLCGKQPILSQAVEHLSAEWLSDLQEELLIPKHLLPIFSWCQKIGQGLRGTLLILSTESFGYAEKKITLSLAACIELLQTALLIHDDIMDGSRTRRDGPSFHEKISQVLASRGHMYHKAEAEKIALAIGNHLITWLNQKIIRLAMETSKPELVEIFNQYTLQTMRGQLADVSNEKIPEDILEVKDLYAAKTGAYTFCLPLVLGYVLAEPAHSITQELMLEVIGENLGIVLQSQDDISGFGEKSDALQELRIDLVNHQPALWLIILSERLNEGEKTFLEKIWKTQVITDADLYYLRYLFQKYNSTQIVRKTTASEAKLCRQLVADLDLEADSSRLWYSLIDHLENGSIT